MTTNYSNSICIGDHPLTIEQLRQIHNAPVRVSLSPSALSRIDAAHATVQGVVDSGKTVYGINTGFGLLASTSIARDELSTLQRNLVLSHATGVGNHIDADTVRVILILKLASLCRGHSGVSRELVQGLVALVNNGIYPAIPEKGSVGASGDLAPLAHMSACLLGVGEAYIGGSVSPVSAEQALNGAGLAPLDLGPKEGLALLNGTQVSTAFALRGLFAIERVYASAVVTGAMSIDAARGSNGPFDARIQEVRGHAGQIDVAHWYRELTSNSEIRESHTSCERVQDPYCLRCQPQVMGAALGMIRFASQQLLVEANAVTDNPLVFPDTGEVLSGGNFHAEPVAMAADMLAIAVAEVGAISERRIALLIDPHLSGLPAFLVEESGVNSGFMIAHVTAAALASENKTLAHPASIDSLPTSANQEDHVSMATFAGRKLADLASNTAVIVGIELLAATQGIDLLRPLTTSPKLEAVVAKVRTGVDKYTVDRYFAPDIEFAAELACSDIGMNLVGELFDA